MATRKDESEAKTRKQRIDPKLDALGWKLPSPSAPQIGPYRSEEYETTAGPADYTLHLDGHVVGIVEA